MLKNERFQCFNDVESFENKIVLIKANVATLDHSALVIEGVCRSRNALLNGDTSNYDWDSGYTCHQVGVWSVRSAHVFPVPNKIFDKHIIQGSQENILEL